MLQGRLFSYTDTHYHRLGTNFMQLPINCPYRARAHNTQRDGPATYDNQGAKKIQIVAEIIQLFVGDVPNYFPNSFNGHVTCPRSVESRFSVTGDVARHDPGFDDVFEQPRIFYKKVLFFSTQFVHSPPPRRKPTLQVLNDQERARLIQNIFDTMKDCKTYIQDRAIQNFGKVSQ
ncbi:unnamed protein product [Cylicostephanus goldi]|uniref:Catalase core domain-containing protein n=1 Tax=Cylicostephanus goldi TaxID=71465 RepID=A0A3P6Q1Y8_CYLGO|nr:unnamed protein product [Cylicostephanus goldi]